MTSTRRIGILAGAVLALVAACGSDDADGGGTGSGGGAASTTTSTTTGTATSTTTGTGSTSSTSSSTATVDMPSAVHVAPGPTPGTAVVTFTPPSSPVTGYTVTADPGGITAEAAAAPITVTGLTPKVDTTFRVVAHAASGDSEPVSVGPVGFYDVVETFHEPMTKPYDTVFTGTFTFDTSTKSVSSLTGSLTESMTGGMSGMGGMGCDPLCTVELGHQLSSVPAAADGLLVATFALDTTDVFAGGGFAPGGTKYYDYPGDNNGNAYALIWVSTIDPTTPPAQAELDLLAYADCTPKGMMGPTCMTGTSEAGYGKKGTMGGQPSSQVITKR